MEKKPNAMYQARQSRGKKTIINKVTKSRVLPPWPFPVEVWVKIFNFLPNQDIRCGVSLVCKKFYEICQNESLVPVKDLCIYGQPVGPKPIEDDDKAYYCLGGVAFLAHIIEKAVSDIISQSKSLTFLKIKALNSEALNQLVLVSLRACPKLSHLEIIEDLHQMELKHNYELMEIIKKFGKNLRSINLLIVGRDETFHWFNHTNAEMINCIIKGCPKLESLSLESLRGWKDPPKDKMSKLLLVSRSTINFDPKVLKDLNDLDVSDCWDFRIEEDSLKDLSKGCKELKDLKLTKITFEDIFIADQIKKMFPDCNVEINECSFQEEDEDDSEQWTTTDDSSSDADDV